MATAETKMDMSLDDVIKATKQQIKKKPAPKAAATPKKGKKGKSPAKAVPVKSPAQKGKKGGKQAVVKAVTAAASAKRQANLAKKRGLGATAQNQMGKNVKKRAMAVAVRPAVQLARAKGKGPKGKLATPVRGAQKAQIAGGRQALLDNLSPAPIPKSPMQIRIVNNSAGKAASAPAKAQPKAKPKPGPRALPARAAPQKKMAAQMLQVPARNGRRGGGMNVAGAVMMAKQNGLMVASRQRPKAQQAPVQYVMVPVNQAKGMAAMAKKQQPAPPQPRRNAQPPPQRRAPAAHKPKPQSNKSLAAARGKAVAGGGRPVMPGDVLAAQNGKRKSPAPAPRLGVQGGGVTKGKGGNNLNRRFTGAGKRR